MATFYSNKVCELYHFGIKGMKWGIRRFQNEDGTLTESGKKRYGKYENSDGTLTDEGMSRYQAPNGGLSRKGKKRLKEVDPESTVGKILRKIDRAGDFNKNWLTAYNKAAEVFNDKIVSLNKRFEGKGIGDKDYTQAVSKLWKETYSKQISKYFNKDGLLDDVDYSTFVPMYNVYDDYV